MPSSITIIAAAIVCLVSVSASAGDISAAAKPDCAQATSDYERSEFGCPIDLAGDPNAATAQPTDTNQ
jgi:hypothetical protein